ncbi:MAG: PTS system mannose/fructose/sorbose family transporter subunit IID [Clostridiales bacterium]|nr:PTS system mannose/fructose/sorbose family transporter subunit IID [Clostridiales bacterium]
MNEMRKTPLTKKEINRLYIRYLLFGCPGVDAIYIQGKSWPWWLLPFFRLYYTADEVKENVVRHFTWYNTEPIAGSLIFGIVLGMEEEKAIYGNVDPETILAIKSGLMGPVAGIGDSLIQATLIPILITLTVAISGENGSIIGPLFYVIALLAIILPFGYVLYKNGYNLGKASLNFFSESGISDITKAIAVFGLIVVGCLSANRVSITTKLSFLSDGESVMLQDMIETIFPNLLSLLIIMFFYWLMKVKKVKMQNLFYITMVAVIILSLVGVV